MESGEVLLGTHRIGFVQGGSPAELSRALRRLAASGAEALVIIGSGGGPASSSRWQSTFDAFRAIECGRHVVRSGAGAAIHDASGRRLAGISAPLEGSVSAEILLTDFSTPYVLTAWRLPRILALVAVCLTVGVAMILRLRGRRSG